MQQKQQHQHVLLICVVLWWNLLWKTIRLNQFAVEFNQLQVSLVAHSSSTTCRMKLKPKWWKKGKISDASVNNNFGSTTWNRHQLICIFDSFAYIQIIHKFNWANNSRWLIDGFHSTSLHRRSCWNRLHSSIVNSNVMMQIYLSRHHSDCETTSRWWKWRVEQFDAQHAQK